MIEPNDLMSLAIEKCRAGIAAGQSPFGCAVARESDVLAVEHNTVWHTTDPTAHAEINAIRAACLKSRSIHLTGCIVATTCEPCPMCMAALHWSRVDKVYFGASIADAEAAGFNELSLPAAEVLRMGRSQVTLEGGVLDRQCRELFAEWRRWQPRPY